MGIKTVFVIGGYNNNISNIDTDEGHKFANKCFPCHHTKQMRVASKQIALQLEWDPEHYCGFLGQPYAGVVSARASPRSSSFKIKLTLVYKALFFLITIMDRVCTGNKLLFIIINEHGN